MSFPKTGGAELAAAQDNAHIVVNEAVRRIDALASRAIIGDRDLTTPPGACADGANYLIAASPTGLWAGQAGKLATAVGTNASNGWVFQTVAVEGYQLYVQDENITIEHNGTGWVALNFGSGGLFTLPVMASAMTARTTTGAASGTSESATNKIMTRTLDFDAAVDEFAQFAVPMPKRWNEGTMTAEFLWTAGATGNVVWGIQAVAISDDDPIDSAFGAAVTITDGVTASGDLMISAATAAITAGGTPVENDVVWFQVFRDADSGTDTLAVDAKLVGIRLKITTNAADDS